MPPHAAQELEITYDALVRASYATEEAQSTLDLISAIWTPQLEARLLETLTDLTTQTHDNTTGPAGNEVLAVVLSHILEEAAHKAALRHWSDSVRRYARPALHVTSYWTPHICASS
ncbi:hypothetical protein MBT84_45675 [Streptomyces sp. MBT84]|uniref:hypothetical protein n=1 Tax=Streptomyces sp. MBT84 TaxID=1488414 RepID=UPI001C6EBC95|nr:hypothetical protein [Streptomyces sp. MBT84]MBW8706945.1 hypothetical protein [Streptomyces sp. MBT84]